MQRQCQRRHSPRRVWKGNHSHLLRPSKRNLSNTRIQSIIRFVLTLTNSKQPRNTLEHNRHLYNLAPIEPTTRTLTMAIHKMNQNQRRRYHPRPAPPPSFFLFFYLFVVMCTQAMATRTGATTVAEATTRSGSALMAETERRCLRSRESTNSPTTTLVSGLPSGRSKSPPLATKNLHENTDGV